MGQLGSGGGSGSDGHRRARAPLKLRQRRRWGVYLAGFGVWASGLLWVVLHQFFTSHGEFGPEPHPLEPWALKAHGAFAFVALWTLGLLSGAHVLGGWEAGRRRISGIALLALLAFLTLTGYLLYYASGERFRAVVSAAHWAVGLAVPAFFLLHRFAVERVRASAVELGRQHDRRVGPLDALQCADLVDQGVHLGD